MPIIAADSASAGHGARVAPAAGRDRRLGRAGVEARQPAKFAALEGIGHTTSHAPFTLWRNIHPKSGRIVGGLRIRTG